MKRFIIAVFALLISCSAVSAQQKGDIYFGGMAGVTIQAVSSNGGSTSAGFVIQPEFGAFVADKCKLGISVGMLLVVEYILLPPLQTSHTMSASARVCTIPLPSRPVSLWLPLEENLRASA